MHIKHLLISGAACLTAAGIFAVPAYAHHSGEYHGCQGRNSSYANSSYTNVCSFEDCSETGIHYHGETAYCGYDHGGGICDGSHRENGCGRSFAADEGAADANSRMGHHGKGRCRR